MCVCVSLCFVLCQNMMKCVFFVMSFLSKKEYLKSSRWTTLENKFDLIRAFFDEYNVCVYM